MSTMVCCLHDTPNVASCSEVQAGRCEPEVQAGRCEHLMLHISYHEVIKAGRISPNLSKLQQVMM